MPGACQRTLPLGGGRPRDQWSVDRTDRVCLVVGWVPMLSTSCARAFASSLVSSRVEIPDGQEGFAPDLLELFAT